MVELVISSNDQDSVRWLLSLTGIEYKIVYSNKLGFNTPFLIVDGVPLGKRQSIKWLRGELKGKLRGKSKGVKKCK